MNLSINQFWLSFLMNDSQIINVFIKAQFLLLCVCVFFEGVYYLLEGHKIVHCCDGKSSTYKRSQPTNKKLFPKKKFHPKKVAVIEASFVLKFLIESEPWKQVFNVSFWWLMHKHLMFSWRAVEEDAVYRRSNCWPPYTAAHRVKLDCDSPE